MRILQVGLSHNPGGIESFVMNYYRELVKYGVQFDFICMYDTLAYEDEIKSLGGTVFHISNVKKHPIRFRKELENILKERQYDALHVNMLSAANIVPLKVGKKVGIRKIIAHSHNSSTPGILRKILHCLNKHQIAKYATDFFACSEVAGKWLFEEQILEGEHFRIIHNALNMEKFCYRETIRKEIRRELQVEDKFVVGHVGRFEEQKNHDFLVDIFYEIAKERKDAVLLLVGDGDLKNQITLKIQKYKIEDQVRFLGVRKDIPQLWNAMDVFVFPSLFEGLPLVALESQASGVCSVMADTISEEVKITDTVTFLPLAQNAKEWKSCILKAASEKRTEAQNEIIKQQFEAAGYDIVTAGKKIMEYYRI